MNDIEFRGRQPNPRRAPVQAAVLKKLLEKRLDSTLTEEYLGHHSYHPKYEIRTDRIGWDLTIVVFFNSFPGLEPSPPGTLEESVVKERAEKIWSDVLPVIWQNGWYVSASRYTDFRCPYAFCAMLNAKPNYTARVEKLPDVLYHVAPTQVASKILSGGLKPYSKSLGFRHPNRVYVSLVSDVSELLDMLSDTQDSQAGYKTIFAVDTSKLRKGTKFYYDEAYELNRRRPPWAWTYSHIPPEALSIVSTWDADDPDLRSNPAKRPVSIVDDERFTNRIIKWGEEYVESGKSPHTQSLVYDRHGRTFILLTYLETGGEFLSWVLVSRPYVIGAGSFQRRHDRSSYKADAGAIQPSFRGVGLYQEVILSLRRLYGPLTSGSTMSPSAVKVWESVGGSYDAETDLYRLNPARMRRR